MQPNDFITQGSTLAGRAASNDAERDLWRLAIGIREAVFQFPNGASREEWLEWWQVIVSEVVSVRCSLFLAR